MLRICKVMEVNDHPNANKLKVCTVDLGEPTTTQVICGAPNVRAGMFTVIAELGTEIQLSPNDKPFTIRVAKLRGIESYGMLCSERELGISENHSGIIDLKDVENKIGCKFKD